MAQRTISATGGNFGSASAWVEAVVPTSGDFIVGNSASGNLTLNTAFTIQYADFSDYRALFNMSSNALTLGLASATTSFGASMSFTYSITGEASTSFGNYGRFISGVAHNFTQTGSVVIPQLNMNAGTKTLTSDIHVYRLRCGSTPTTLNGNKINVYEHVLSSADTSNNSIAGTTRLVALGTGSTNVFQLDVQNTTEFQGQYHHQYLTPTLNNNGRIVVATASDSSRLYFTLAAMGSANKTYYFETYSKLGCLRTSSEKLAGSLFSDINCENTTFKCDYFFMGAIGLPAGASIGAWDGRVFYRFFGVGCNIQNFYNAPYISITNKSGGFPPANQQFQAIMNDFRFDSNGTWTIDNLYSIGPPVPDGNMGIRSITASTIADLVIENTTSYIKSATTRDIEAIGDTMFVFSATISNSINVATGSGVIGSTAGGGVSGPYGFAFVS
jgi:hypothetical protein